MGSMELHRKVYVCRGTGCISSGGNATYEALKAEVAHAGLTNAEIDFTGCHGFCQQGPNVVVEPDGIFYTHVEPEDAAEIVASHLRKGEPVSRLFYQDPVTGKAIPHYSEIDFYQKQTRVILRNCGHINPERIDDYIACGGYQSLRKALFKLTPEQVIDEIKRAGLRGRGGAGFPTATKWEYCRRAPGSIKYVICNADEGDPGAFMDRSILEADPHSVLEGLTIAAYAIGARQGYVYCRAEKPLAIERIKIALSQMPRRNLIGENILGSGFNFQIEIREGAGAFVCGEETALIASIESRRGMPRPSSPLPRPIRS